MGDNRFNKLYDLWSLRADVEETKERLMQLTYNLTPELNTLKNHGHKIESIIRRV